MFGPAFVLGLSFVWRHFQFWNTGINPLWIILCGSSSENSLMKRENMVERGLVDSHATVCQGAAGNANSQYIVSLRRHTTTWGVVGTTCGILWSLT